MNDLSSAPTNSPAAASSPAPPAPCSASGLLPGLFLQPRARRERRRKGGTAKNVIYLYMDGGMSHVDTWDPKQGEVAGPTQDDPDERGRRDARRVSAAHRKADAPRHDHPLAHLHAGRARAGQLLHAHELQLRGTINHPSMGAWLAHFRGAGNPTLPASVYVGNASRHPGAGFFSPELAPLFVNNPENGLHDIEPQKGLTEDAQTARMQLAERAGRGLRAHFRQAAQRGRALRRLRWRVPDDGEQGHRRLRSDAGKSRSCARHMGAIRSARAACSRGGSWSTACALSR